MAVLFILYLAVLLRITVFRHNFDIHCRFQNGVFNLSLFADYIPMLRQGKWGLFIYLFGGNLAWFIPFGWFVYCLRGMGSIRGAVLLGFLFSFMIEALQYVFGTGVSEVDDLVLNTLGAWIGAMLGRLFARRRRAGR